jgi:hypothetical protein
MKLLNLRLFAISFLLVGPASVLAQWTANGHDAMFAMYLPQAEKPEANAVFMVSYRKQWGCRPFVSVILMTGRKLGTPERQGVLRKRENQLTVQIDSHSFTDESKLTKYSNGIELAMFAPPGLINAMNRTPSSVIAKMGSASGGFDFSDGKGFTAANASAAANCS